MLRTVAEALHRRQWSDSPIRYAHGTTHEHTQLMSPQLVTRNSVQSDHHATTRSCNDAPDPSSHLRALRAYGFTEQNYFLSPDMHRCHEHHVVMVYTDIPFNQPSRCLDLRQ